MLQINQDSFKKEVLETKGLVFVDFFAEWCGPCKMTAPVLEELSKEVTGVKFVKIDVDKNPELSTEQSVFSIPTFIIFKDGQPINQFSGAMSKEAFLEHIKKATG